MAATSAQPVRMGMVDAYPAHDEKGRILVDMAPRMVGNTFEPLRDHPTSPPPSPPLGSPVRASTRSPGGASAECHVNSATSKPLSGLLYNHCSGVASYVAFEAIGGNGEPVTMHQDSLLSVLPKDVAILASNRGLVCARARESGSYYIANPQTWQCKQLPPPLASHGNIGDAGVVLAFEERPADHNCVADFHVVVAFPDFQGVCAFECFSSKAWAWRLSGEATGVEKVVAASGVGAMGRAFWRSILGTVVVCYDPAADRCDLIDPPLALSTMGSTAWWELGEMEGRLCVTLVAEHAPEVEVLHLESICPDVEKMWRQACRFCSGELSNRRRWWVKVLRSQGASEVVMWDSLGDRVVAMDLHGRTSRTVERKAGPGYCADFVPYVGSLLEISGHIQEQDEHGQKVGATPRRYWT